MSVVSSLGVRADLFRAHFLEAVAVYAREVGYNSVAGGQPTGSKFAKSPKFCQKAARRPGCATPILQFDGIGNAANSHRRSGQPVRRQAQAMENLHKAGVENRSGDHHHQRHQQRQVGRIIKFALDKSQADSVLFPSSRSRSPDATRRSPTTGARRSGTRCRTWRTT